MAVTRRAPTRVFRTYSAAWHSRNELRDRAEAVRPCHSCGSSLRDKDRPVLGLKESRGTCP